MEKYIIPTPLGIVDVTYKDEVSPPEVVGNDDAIFVFKTICNRTIKDSGQRIEYPPTAEEFTIFIAEKIRIAKIDAPENGS